MSVLNEFLTSHQNNYRRWYKRISETDKIFPINGDELVFHMTPISEVQKNYYRYRELCTGFEEVNQYFVDKVKETFEIHTDKWNRSL